MNDRQTRTLGYANRDWAIFLLISTYLIGSFLWRALAVAHESPLRTEQLLTIGVDVAAVVGLIGLKTQLSKGKQLFWIALMAGLGLLAIRLNGDSSWWSGHLVFKLCPREGEEIVCSCRDQFALTWLCP